MQRIVLASSPLSLAAGAALLGAVILLIGCVGGTRSQEPVATSPPTVATARAATPVATAVATQTAAQATATPVATPSVVPVAPKTPPPDVPTVVTVAPQTPTPDVPTAVPVTVVPLIPCAYAQPFSVVDFALEDATTRAVGRLTAVLGCVPFTPGPDGAVIMFDALFFDNSDAFGFDWYWVPAAGFLPDHQDKRILINPRCWARVDGDWSLAIAHELGHGLGWADMDGHPYMTCPLVAGEYYRSDLVVVCGP